MAHRVQENRIRLGAARWLHFRIDATSARSRIVRQYDMHHNIDVDIKYETEACGPTLVMLW